MTTHTIRSIVVGSSLSPESDAVVAAALTLSRALGAKLHVVHGFLPPVGPIGEAVPAMWLDPELLAARERGLRADLKAQVERVGVRSGELAGLVLGPLPAYRLLVDTADEAQADLLVVGAGEHGHLLGSTAERVVRSAHTPVFIPRGAMRLPPARVLLPVDLSERSADAFRTGLGFLAQLGESSGEWPRVEALFVLLDYLHQLAVQFTPEQVQRLVEHELGRFVDAAAGDRPVERRLRVGEVLPEIQGEIESTAADLVILGTHGRGGLQRFLIGSVAEALARTATCNLLIVPLTRADRAVAAA